MQLSPGLKVQGLVVFYLPCAKIANFDGGFTPLALSQPHDSPGFDCLSVLCLIGHHLSSVSPTPVLNPRRSDWTFKVNGVGDKWDLGLVVFDTPKVSILSLPPQLRPRTEVRNQLKRLDDAETIIANFHRTRPPGPSNPILELRPGSEDIQT